MAALAADLGVLRTLGLCQLITQGATPGPAAASRKTHR
jgi:hypothetical protein